jgi:hypothetical protein
MKNVLLFVCLIAFTLPAKAAADGITGRWASATDAPLQIKLSIAKAGEVYEVSHYWTGPTSMAMETLKYAATGTAAQGALSLVPKVEPMSSAPHKLTYSVKGSSLLLKVAEGDFSGEHKLTRVSLTTAAAAKALAKARAKNNPPLTAAALLGAWQTAENETVQVAFEFYPGKADSELQVAQQWSDQLASSMSSNIAYQLVQQAGRRSLQAKETTSIVKAPEELRLLNIEIDGDMLLVTLDSGHHMGTHLLHKKAP